MMYTILGEDEGEAGFILANQIIKRALCTPGATIHKYDKPGICIHKYVYRMYITHTHTHTSQTYSTLMQSAKYKNVLLIKLQDMRKQRKMGHIIVVGSSMGIVEAQVKSFLKE
ncbi:putative phosphoribosylaminoimidazole carboxylase [Helianthus annuus]|nr:putative phosphoribosylaminoimidazole carboxylase [Helianthus annuus]